MIKLNKKVFLLFLLLILLALQGVNAADSENLTLELQYQNNNILNENENSFTELQSLINGGNTTINLEKDYVYYDGEKTIEISKNVTINGNGHSIDANNKIRAFYISADNVVLNNITIQNGNNKQAGAIYWEGANGIIRPQVPTQLINMKVEELYGGLEITAVSQTPNLNQILQEVMVEHYG